MKTYSSNISQECYSFNLHLGSMTHFGLIFCGWCEDVMLSHSFACGFPVVPELFVAKHADFSEKCENDSVGHKHLKQ